MRLFDKKLESYKPFFIAEISCNHCGDKEKAKQLIHAARNAGADAVKIQIYEPEDLASRRVKTKFTQGPWKGKSLWDIYSKTHTPVEWIDDLIKEAEKAKINIFPSVYNHAKVKSIHRLWGFKAYKVASYEVGYIKLIEACASTGSTVIVSSTQRSMFFEASQIIKHNGVILSCSNNYNNEFDFDAVYNMSLIPYMNKDIGFGLSEHSIDSRMSVIACEMGAQVIEKHLNLYNNEFSFDATFSLDVAEYKNMIIDTTYKAVEAERRLKYLKPTQKVVGRTSTAKRKIVEITK